MTALVICVLHFRPICNDVILDPHREQRLPYFVPANARAYLWQLAIVWPSKLNQTHASVSVLMLCRHDKVTAQSPFF